MSLWAVDATDVDQCQVCRLKQLPALQPVPPHYVVWADTLRQALAIAKRHEKQRLALVAQQK